ncbi:Protein slit, partial [Armadillidium nasatum]
CHCPPGFEGLRCEKNINDCEENKCENNSTCVDLVMSYKCQCQPGYTGKINLVIICIVFTYKKLCVQAIAFIFPRFGNYCEKKIAFCTKEFNPCKNGARCVNHVTHYECQCSLGFSGDNCTENIDDCINHLCQNGASCVDGINDYSCKCVGDYSGKFCEVGPAAYQQTSPCQQNDCQNGICFVPPNSQDYVCKCSPGFSGKHCEYLTRVHFGQNNSFLTLDPLKTKPYSNVTLHFKTSKESGILLYTGESAHLAVELFLGRVRVSYDVGNHPVSNMFSYEVVSDDEWHTIEMLTHKQNFTMRIDGGSSRWIINAGRKEYLASSSPLYLGGLPKEVAQKAVDLYHVRDSTSFNGCMQRVYVNSRLTDLDSGQQHKVVPGCGGEEAISDEGENSVFTEKVEKNIIPIEKLNRPKSYGHNDVQFVYVILPLRTSYALSVSLQSLHSRKGLIRGDHLPPSIHPPALPEETPKRDPCENHKCRRGRCKAKNRNPFEYYCRCRTGWSGKFCDQPPTCRKEQFTEYYVENECRSRKPIKNAICSGTCGNHCCKPRKTKQRKVRLICNDGTSYRKEIEIIRKCRCIRRLKRLDFIIAINRECCNYYHQINIVPLSWFASFEGSLI